VLSARGALITVWSGGMSADSPSLAVHRDHRVAVAPGVGGVTIPAGEVVLPVALGDHVRQRPFSGPTPTSDLLHDQERNSQ
jgi:hypothetical protein